MRYLIKLANISALLIYECLIRCVNTESKRTIGHVGFNQKVMQESDSGSGYICPISGIWGVFTTLACAQKIMHTRALGRFLNNIACTRRNRHGVYLSRTYLLESCVLYDLDFTGDFMAIFEGATSFVDVCYYTDKPIITG